MAEVASAKQTVAGAVPPAQAAKSVKDNGKLLEESKQRSMDVIAGTQSLLTIIILALACIVSFSSRLFAVIRFESIIHEFDPWWVQEGRGYGAGAAVQGVGVVLGCGGRGVGVVRAVVGGLGVWWASCTVDVLHAHMFASCDHIL